MRERGRERKRKNEREGEKVMHVYVGVGLPTVFYFKEQSFIQLYLSLSFIGLDIDPYVLWLEIVSLIVEVGLT